MGKLILTPFNQDGNPVTRAQVSVKEAATRQRIAELVAGRSRVAGIGTVVHVEVNYPDGRLHSAWDVRHGCVVQTDGSGSESFETARIPIETGIMPTTPESKMANVEQVVNREAADGTATKPNAAVADGGAKADAAANKKAKAAKAPKEPKAEKPKVDRGPTKKDQVLEMMRAKGGTTVDDIQKKLGISAPAARALIGDCQRVAGVTVKREKVDNVSRYSA